MSPETPQLEYKRRREDALAAEARFDARSALIGNSRVLLLIGAIAFYFIERSRGASQPGWAYALLAFLGVLSLIIQDRADRLRDRAHIRTLHYDHSLERLEGKWKTFPSHGDRFDTAEHSYARDLDVLGTGSLFQLLDTTRTARGESTLADWLLTPGALPEVRERRAAVQALQRDLDARERLSIAGLDAELSRIDETPLLTWAEGPALFEPPKMLIAVARVLPFLTLPSLWLFHEGVLPLWPGLLLLAGHALIIWRNQQNVKAIGGIAENTEAMLTRLLPLLEAAAQQPVTTPRLQDLVARLNGAVEATRSLRQRVSVFQSRGNLFVVALSPFVLWDFHSALLLQRWWESSRSRVRGWLEALGALEALSAMATYAYEHDEDIWPELSDGPATFTADGLGHPLLPLEKCVRNDVALGGAGTALLVTGSNMSGKSTLLRAVGLNVVLALAGLPVRARSLKVSFVRLATVMRVSDSLQEGASFFLAELRRLKGVVDLAHEGTPVLFLLDEILLGTNTRERSLGARGVIAHLLDTGAFGLVSTHDLSLVQLEDHFRERIRYAHFTDQVQGEEMTFDYKLRPGIVRTSNALRLMKAIGLRVEIPEE